MLLVKKCCWVCENLNEQSFNRFFFFCEKSGKIIYYDDAFSELCENFMLKQNLMVESERVRSFPHECLKLIVLLEEFMDYVENPALSIVEEACSFLGFLGYPIKDEKGCYCRLVKPREEVGSCEQD